MHQVNDSLFVLLHKKVQLLGELKISTNPSLSVQTLRRNCVSMEMHFFFLSGIEVGITSVRKAIVKEASLMLAIPFHFVNCIAIF